MSIERIALAALSVVCLGLGGWNVRLHQELSSTQTELSVQIEAVASVSTPAQAAPKETATRPPQHSSEPHGHSQKTHPPNTAIIIGDAKPAQGVAPQRSAQDWQDMSADIERKTVDTVQRMAQERDWPSEVTDEVLTVLLESGDDMAAVWTDMRNEQLTHYEARKEVHKMRNDVEEQIVNLVGEEDYQSLDEQLFEDRRATWGGGHR